MSQSEIAQLRQIVEAGFAEIGRRLEAHDGRFDSVDGRLDVLARHLMALDARVTSLDTRLDDFRRATLQHFDEIYRRFERLEQEYHAITEALRRLEAHRTTTDLRTDTLERDVTDLRQRVGDLESRLDAFEREVRD